LVTYAGWLDKLENVARARNYKAWPSSGAPGIYLDFHTSGV
jgi:hypothetical protein